MASPTAWKVYDEFSLNLGKKVFNLATDVFKMALFSSTSNVGSAGLVTARYATATNELATASGYTAGGVSCAPTYTNAAGAETFDVADASWTATGTLTARFA